MVDETYYIYLGILSYESHDVRQLYDEYLLVLVILHSKFSICSILRICGLLRLCVCLMCKSLDDYSECQSRDTRFTHFPRIYTFLDNRTNTVKVYIIIHALKGLIVFIFWRRKWFVSLTNGSILNCYHETKMNAWIPAADRNGSVSFPYTPTFPYPHMESRCIYIPKRGI